jgi:YbgC/YbaW family acyl-CoA thioester hydrolase
VSVEHVERLRVAWIDTDAGGRIHFSNAFRWAEAAEVGLIRNVLSVEEWADFPRKHVQAEFLEVLRFDDEIEVRIRVDRLGTTSITYAWTISKDGVPHVLGGHTVVHVGADGRPSPIPNRIRQALSG